MGISASLGALALAGALRKERFEWQGKGFGGEISITLKGDEARAKAATKALTSTIDALEERFSLFRESSEISLLNRAGFLDEPSDEMREILGIARGIWAQSGGRFDPCVQGLWRQKAAGLAPSARAEFGRVELDERLDLGGQELTLNGIAQGYAADQISALLARYGFENTLVNLGEYRARGGAWRMEIDNADGRALERLTLDNAAVSTSSALSDRVGGASHILDPKGGAPQWQTVSVVARTGALADGWSTAMMLMNEDEIRALDCESLGIRHVIAEGLTGEIFKLG